MKYKARLSKLEAKHAPKVIGLAELIEATWSENRDEIMKKWPPVRKGDVRWWLEKTLKESRLNEDC